MPRFISAEDSGACTSFNFALTKRSPLITSHKTKHFCCLIYNKSQRAKKNKQRLIERTFSSKTETIILNISYVKKTKKKQKQKSIILWKLLDFTVSIQIRMATEKCNLLSTVFIPLLCSTFETYFNFKFLLTAY